eukprot:GFYU01005981.1.p2 GENE.GFYU01005981.1~~GFYU01005981.1.p2  ORF type:complete len:127 (-),score=2.48 GFYU01005981.1:144-524(-)
MSATRHKATTAVSLPEQEYISCHCVPDVSRSTGQAPARELSLLIYYTKSSGAHTAARQKRVLPSTKYPWLKHHPIQHNERTGELLLQPMPDIVSGMAPETTHTGPRQALLSCEIQGLQTESSLLGR